jgi:hypothetical protein
VPHYRKFVFTENNLIIKDKIRSHQEKIFNLTLNPQIIVTKLVQDLDEVTFNLLLPSKNEVVIKASPIETVKVENVDFVYTQLMNSDKVSIRIQIEINGIMFDLYRLHFTFDELYNELLNSNLIDKYWSIHYLILNDSQLMDDYQQQSIHPIDDLQYPLNKLNL